MRLTSQMTLALVLVSSAFAVRAYGNRPDAAIGDYHITVFMPESDGSTDPSLEDWTEPMETEVVDQVVEACMHWADTAPDSAGLTCHVTYYNYTDTPTSYEPITRPGGEPLWGFWGGDEDEWINEMMDITGFSSALLFYYQEVEDYNERPSAPSWSTVRTTRTASSRTTSRPTSPSCALPTSS